MDDDGGENDRFCNYGAGFIHAHVFLGGSAVAKWFPKWPFPHKWSLKRSYEKAAKNMLNIFPHVSLFLPQDHRYEC